MTVSSSSGFMSNRLFKCAVATLALAAAGGANAVPSFARQTGQDCAACHIGAYGPHLTPYGVKFKLGGYVDTDGRDGKVPLSAMVVAGRTSHRDDDGNKTHDSGLAEASVFLAGRISEHLGSFVQMTYDGLEHHSSIDQADIRYAREVKAGGRDVLLGVSLNNNPTVQDPFNTLPVWSFPFVASPYGNSVGSEFIGLGGTEQKVLGINAYALINSGLYAEVGLYNTLSPAFQSKLGLSRDDAQEFGRLANAPYWRLAYMKDLKHSAWSVGMFGFGGRLKDRLSGETTSRFNDLGVDASYQYLGTRRHVMTVDASVLREHQDTPSGTDAGAFERINVKDMRLSTSYHYLNTFGGSVGVFKSSSSDGQSENRGTIWQGDWTPWGKESSWLAPLANLRLGVQYVKYGRYVEGGAVLDRPSVKDTGYLFGWTSF